LINNGDASRLTLALAWMLTASSRAAVSHLLTSGVRSDASILTASICSSYIHTQLARALSVRLCVCVCVWECILLFSRGLPSMHQGLWCGTSGLSCWLDEADLGDL